MWGCTGEMGRIQVLMCFRDLNPGHPATCCAMSLLCAARKVLDFFYHPFLTLQIIVFFLLKVNIIYQVFVGLQVLLYLKLFLKHCFLNWSYICIKCSGKEMCVYVWNVIVLLCNHIMECFVLFFFCFPGSLLLESKINPNTAYQKQQVKMWRCYVLPCMLSSQFGD